MKAMIIAGILTYTAVNAAASTDLAFDNGPEATVHLVAGKQSTSFGPQLCNGEPAHELHTKTVDINDAYEVHYSLEIGTAERDAKTNVCHTSKTAYLVERFVHVPKNGFVDMDVDAHAVRFSASSSHAQ